MATIRNFFAPIKKPTDASASSPATKPDEPKKRKARVLVISSDEDDNEPAKKSPSKSSAPNLKKIKKQKSDEKSPRGKPVDIATVFGSEPIKRIEKRKAPQKLNQSLSQAEIDRHFDDDFEMDDAIESSLIEEDSSLILKADKKSTNGKHVNVNGNGNRNRSPRSPKKSVKEEKLVASPKKADKSPNKEEHASPKKENIKKEVKTPNRKPTTTTPKSRKRTANTSAILEDSALTDEDRQERKRISMMMYQQFKNRGGPAHPGSKELPKGKPNCLSGCTFVLTGVLDSMEREEAAELIREHGGKVTTSLSRKTSYMVVGEESGLQKIAKAEELGTRILDEDALLNLIRKKSDMPTVDTKKESPNSPAKKLIKKEVLASPSKKSIKKETSPIKKESVTPNKNDVSPVRRSPRKAGATKPLIKLEPKDRPVLKLQHSVDLLVDRTETQHQKNIASVENQAWVDKYKPTSVKQIIGQQGAASNVVKLTNWLTKWYVNQNGPKKPGRPNPWAKNDDGAFYKAALLSGPPGVGKTTTAMLVSKELGFDVVEFNASDTRSKRLLKEEVSELLSNKSLYGYFHGSDDAVTVKHVLLMDEVDGMAGNEDRGGIQELLALIKDSSVPIICMCNDRNHQKMRSLVNHCYDLRFNRPMLAQIKGSMMSMCFKEGVKVSPAVLEEVITATNNDIRQTINHLSLLSASKDVPVKGGDGTQKPERTAQKDMKLGPWEVVRKVFSAEEHKKMTLSDKSDLFFHDYSLGPLFVQQNYLQVAPKVAKSAVPKHVAMAADCLSLGDLVESRIRSKMAWSMLPTQAMFSSVMPGEYMSGTITGQINFPGWLGKNSKSNKRSRMAQEVHDHTRIRTSGSRRSVRLDYAGFLLDKIVRPLRERGTDGVDDALATLKEYHLLREDLESLIELTSWPGKKNPFDAVESKVKAALTRAYNKEVNPYTYSNAVAIKKKKEDTGSDDMYGDSGSPDGGGSSCGEEDEDGIENDVLIKSKKKAKPSAAASAPAKKATAASSRTKGKSK